MKIIQVIPHLGSGGAERFAVDICNELAYKAIGKILEIVKICSVTNAEVLTSFQKKAKDFEDCLVAVCAKSINCDYIVTRNIKDFEEFDIPAIAPADLLSRL